MQPKRAEVAHPAGQRKANSGSRRSRTIAKQRIRGASAAESKIIINPDEFGPGHEGLYAERAPCARQEVIVLNRETGSTY